MILAVLIASFQSIAAPADMEVQAIPVHLNPDSATAREVGALTYLGGLELISDNSAFGGLSGLELNRESETRLIGGVISDEGRAGRIIIQLSPDRRPQSVTITLSALSGLEPGRRNKRDVDAEGLAGFGGLLAISYERNHRIEFVQPGAGAVIPGPTPEGIEAADDNRGLEALAFLPDGTLLAGAESVTPTGAPHPVWRFDDPQASAPPAFQLNSAGPGYGLVGMDATPAGNLVILERFYLPAIGNKIAVSWLDGDTAKTASGRVDARMLGVIEPPLTVDNFEGVAAVEGPDGATEVWLISDDNFSNRQRTLLLGFSFDEARIAREEAGP